MALEAGAHAAAPGEAASCAEALMARRAVPAHAALTGTVDARAVDAGPLAGGQLAGVPAPPRRADADSALDVADASIVAVAVTTVAAAQGAIAGRPRPEPLARAVPTDAAAASHAVALARTPRGAAG